jgi:hypothetical protein
VAQSQPRLSVYTSKLILSSCGFSDAINREAAFRAGLVRPDLADPFKDFDGDALLGQVGEEAADGVRCLAHGLGNLRSAGTFVAAQHG